MRESIHSYYVRMLDIVQARGTCLRRQVGAILTDETGHVLNTAYNGPPSKEPHCVDFPCAGANDPPGDTRRCLAVHAEQNLLIQCQQLFRAHTMYVTVTPCFTCAKMICNTPIQRIIITGPYADDEGGKLLRRRGLLWFFNFKTGEICEKYHL
jgi:dCMP deaminase